MFWYPFLGTLCFLYIYIKSIYIAISNETFFDLIHFSDKMMLKKLHTKENQKTYFLDGTNQHRIETENTCQQINILYIHGYVSKRGVFFWFQKGFFERKEGHLILRQPSHTHTYIYIWPFWLKPFWLKQLTSRNNGGNDSREASAEEKGDISFT